jgi:hypothetical protein
MADGVSITQGSGTTIFTDDVGGVHYQGIKIVLGADGAADTLVDSGQQLMADSVPVVLASDHSDVKVTLDSEAVVLGAGAAAIGKLSANSGVDIGDVDVTSCALPTGAATSAKQDTAQTALDAIKTAVEVIDNAISGSEMQVDVLTVPTPIRGPGNPVVDSYTSVAVSAAANTANQSLVAAPGANKQIWVYGLVLTADTGDGSFSLQDEDDTAKSGVMEITRRGGFALSPSGNFSMPWFKVATNKALEIDTVTSGAKGILSYAIIDVS